MAADKMLADHERAHTGKPGMKPRHGQDAIGKVPVAGGPKRFDALEKAGQNYQPIYQKLNFGRDLP